MFLLASNGTYSVFNYDFIKLDDTGNGCETRHVAVATFSSFFPTVNVTDFDATITKYDTNCDLVSFNVTVEAIHPSTDLECHAAKLKHFVCQIIF